MQSRGSHEFIGLGVDVVKLDHKEANPVESLAGCKKFSKAFLCSTLSILS